MSNTYCLNTQRDGDHAAYDLRFAFPFFLFMLVDPVRLRVGDGVPGVCPFSTIRCS